MFLSRITPEMLHSLLLMVMIVLLVSRRSIGRQDLKWRVGFETPGLRVALITELEALNQALAITGELLAAGTLPGLSGRPFFSAYRGNMHRFMALTENEIAAVVAAHAASELLDSAIQIRQRQLRRARTAGADAKVLNVDWLHRGACEAAATAVAVLREGMTTRTRSPSPWAQLRAWWHRRWSPGDELTLPLEPHTP